MIVIITIQSHHYHKHARRAFADGNGGATQAVRKSARSQRAHVVPPGWALGLTPPRWGCLGADAVPGAPKHKARGAIPRLHASHRRPMHQLATWVLRMPIRMQGHEVGPMRRAKAARPRARLPSLVVHTAWRGHVRDHPRRARDGRRRGWNLMRWRCLSRNFGGACSRGCRRPPPCPDGLGPWGPWAEGC